MADIHESIECLCDSPHRLRILDVLDGDRMDVRDLIVKLDSPRSTVQRNLSVLEEQGWIEPTTSGYMTTAIGTVLYEEFATLNETVETAHRIAPFFEAVDLPPEIDVRAMIDALVTTPRPGRPNAPTKRLFDAFDGSDVVRGFLPVVSCLVAELFGHEDRDIVEHEYIVPDDVFDTLNGRAPDERTDEFENSVHVELRLYDGNIPYGLFVSERRLVLAAYDGIGRLQALVESTNEAAVEWGERTYDTYRRQSTKPEADMPFAARNTELVD